MLIPGHLFCSGMDRYLNTVFLQKNKQVSKLCEQMSILGENNNNNMCRTEILLQAGRPPWNENCLFIHKCVLSLVYIEMFLLTCSQSSNPEWNATLLGCSKTTHQGILACNSNNASGNWRTFRSHFRNEEKTFDIWACEFFYARAAAKRFTCVSWHETTHLR